MSDQVSIRVFSGPTALVEYGGLRLLTDPTFDGPGDYELGPSLVLTKTSPSPVGPTDVGSVDAVLLSHDQHPDNLDISGPAFLDDVPLVLTTRSGAANIGGRAHGLAPWETARLDRPAGGFVTVTATPARHGPEGCEPITGEVIGFILTGDDLPTVYISGDNAALELVNEIGDRFGPVDTALLFAGAARTPFFDDALVTIDSAQAAEATKILQARRVVVAHCDSWSHFTESCDDAAKAFSEAGLADRLQRR